MIYDEEEEEDLEYDEEEEDLEYDEEEEEDLEHLFIALIAFCCVLVVKLKINSLSHKSSRESTHKPKPESKSRISKSSSIEHHRKRRRLCDQTNDERMYVPLLTQKQPDSILQYIIRRDCAWSS